MKGEIAIIPAKEYSERLQNKNILKINGIELWEYSVNYAKSENIIPIVSTDSEYIINKCKEKNILYVKETVDDSNLCNCINQVISTYYCEKFAVLQPTSPIRKPGLLQDLFYRNTDSSIYTAQKIKIIGHINDEFKIAYREQQATNFLYHFDGNMIIVNKKWYLKNKCLFNNDSTYVIEEMPYNLQIDTKEEYEVIKTIIEIQKQNYKRIAIIGNKEITTVYNFDNYDYIVRVNGCSNLKNTYSEKTNLWFFGGADGVFKNQCNENKQLQTYINKNCIEKLVCHPHNISNLVNNYDVFNDMNIFKDAFNIVKYPYNEKLLEKMNHCKSVIRAVCYVLKNVYKTGDIIDLYAYDIDRCFNHNTHKFENNGWHCYAEEDYNFLKFLVKNKFIYVFEKTPYNLQINTYKENKVKNTIIEHKKNKIAIIGNKVTNTKYDLSEYDCIIRYNGMPSLENTYTNKTNVWVFGGNYNVFKNTQLNDKLFNYINNNCIKKLTYNDKIGCLKQTNITDLNIIENMSHEQYLKSFCEKINYEYDNKLNRITTIVNIILHTVYYNIENTIDIYCWDDDRKEKTDFHIYPEEEYKLIKYLEDNNYINVIQDKSK